MHKDIRFPGNENIILICRMSTGFHPEIYSVVRNANWSSFFFFFTFSCVLNNDHFNPMLYRN